MLEPKPINNVTKEYKMRVHSSVFHSAYLVGMTIIALTIIYLSWGFDAPIGNFAICFGGCLLGHVVTEILNENEVDE